MKRVFIVFLIAGVYACSGYADSFLTAQQFPKTFEDLSFKSRIEVLREGYKPFEVEYDENGVCISGCAYKGLTIKDDMDAVDEANEEMAELIAAENQSNQQDFGRQQTERKSKSELAHIKPDMYYSDQPDDDTPVAGESVPKDWCRNGLTTKLPLRYPVDMSDFKYKITSDFGFRKIKQSKSNFHPAIDIGCPVGTPVYATADGIVEEVGFDNYGGGNYVNIKHENGLVTQYMHLKKSVVSKGQVVNACQQIALSGNTGSSSGPHLDYRVRFESDKNKYVDILCPIKASNKTTKQSYDTDVSDMVSEHSLFYNQYRFSPYKTNSNDVKRSIWRTEHGHCMSNVNDLLPDEVR